MIVLVVGVWHVPDKHPI